jgi:hypothetical protein
MTRILFFSTRADLLTVLEPIEGERGLVYYPYGRYPKSSKPRRYASAAQITELGYSPTGNDDTDTWYLILPSTTPLVLRKNRYVPDEIFVDHDDNPAAVVLIPGGCYGRKCIIQGTLLADGKYAEAMKLLNAYRRRLRKEFRRVPDCYVGPAAFELGQKKSVRLTDSARSSPDRRLQLPPPEDSC